jgi:hypothetical protein
MYLNSPQKRIRTALSNLEGMIVKQYQAVKRIYRDNRRGFQGFISLSREGGVEKIVNPLGVTPAELGMEIAFPRRSLGIIYNNAVFLRTANQTGMAGRPSLAATTGGCGGPPHL